MDVVFSCFKCGEAIPVGSGEKVRLRDTCPKCDADLHCCLTCRFYDAGAHNQCREPQAEWVRYKEEANHCDYFEPLVGASRRRGAGAEATAAARKKFDDLFKI